MKKKKTTIQHYNSWKRLKYGLYAFQWSAPFIPATIITAINWQEWFKENNSLPFGFVSLLVSVLLSILMIYKRDETAESKVSPIYSVAMIIAVWGVTFLLLGSLMNNMGMLFLATAGGCVGSGTSNQVIQSKVQPMIDEYRKLIDDNLLDKKALEKDKREQQAKEEAKQIVKVKIKSGE